MTTNIFIYGAGQGGLCVLEVIQAMNKVNNTQRKVLFFVDDNVRKQTNNLLSTNIPVIFKSEIKKQFCDVSGAIIAIAEPKIRIKKYRFLSKNNISCINVIHPRAFISSSAKIGKGIFIKAGTIIATNTQIKDFCIIDNGVVVPHDNVLEEGVFLAPGVTLGSNIHIKKESFIGIGANILTGITIGKNCYVGAGANVIKNLPNNSIAYGNPAKVTGTKHA